jgi:hypothetical protein
LFFPPRDAAAFAIPAPSASKPAGTVSVPRWPERGRHLGHLTHAAGHRRHGAVAHLAHHLFISMNCLRSWLTAVTLVPEPLAIRVNGAIRQ